MKIENTAGFGLIAVDKSAGRILFLDSQTLEIRKVLDDLPRKPHELLVLPQKGKAYVPIFGDGVHGDNPHPEHHIAVVDLASEQVITLIDLSPYKGPHTARRGYNGLIYCCCEESAVIVIIDPHTDTVTGTINSESHNVHRLAVIPGKNVLITESEEEGGLSQIVFDDNSGRIVKKMSVPGSLNGIDVSPIRPWIIATNGRDPEIFVIDREQWVLLDTIPLKRHHKPAQIVRFRNDGEIVAVIGDFDPVVSFFDADLHYLFTAELQKKPLDGTFTPDGRYFLVANEESGTVSVISLEEGRVAGHVPVPEGCEVLAYYPLKPFASQQ